MLYSEQKYNYVTIEQISKDFSNNIVNIDNDLKEKHEIDDEDIYTE
jgi:hypothetical protein